MSESPEIVYVVDDDPSLRTSLERLFRSVHTDCVSFSTALEFLRCDRREGPACLVLDVRLPGLSGLDLQQEMSRSNTEIPIIFLTGHGDIPLTVRAMKGGAVDFLTKPFNPQDMLDAVRKALDRDRAAKQQRSENSILRQRYETLTPREREVFSRIVAGMLSKQVAAELGITERTVTSHRHQVMEKMQVDSLTDLVRISEKLGAHISKT